MVVRNLTNADVASFEPQAIRRGFQYNREHPVLMKSLLGLSHRFTREMGIDRRSILHIDCRP